MNLLQNASCAGRLATAAGCTTTRLEPHLGQCQAGRPAAPPQALQGLERLLVPVARAAARVQGPHLLQQGLLLARHDLSERGTSEGCAIMQQGSKTCGLDRDQAGIPSRGAKKTHPLAAQLPGVLQVSPTKGSPIIMRLYVLPLVLL